jgi:acetylornithine deacetylase/succinyl-diaminopimelate desuccinylase-like protein
MVTDEIPAPEGAPTVLLHGHDDVVPASDDKFAHVRAANERVLAAESPGRSARAPGSACDGLTGGVGPAWTVPWGLGHLAADRS